VRFVQQVFVAPAMPVYTTGTISKVVQVPPNQTVTVEFKMLRALQSIFVSNVTNPQPYGSISAGSYTVKIFSSPSFSSPPNEADTQNLIATFKDFFGYIPVHQLMPGGSSHTYIIIRNNSLTDTLVVSVTGEA